MISGKLAVGLVVLALFASEGYAFSGNCTWIPFERPPWCMGYYKCDSCGVQCGCVGGSKIEPCPAPTTKCMSGPGPTCAKAGPGKCDYCPPYFSHHTDYGCSECLSDHECQQNHHPKSPGANYRKFCFVKTGLCDGECGVGGNGYCQKTYGGKKNLCIDANDTGGWCYQCDGFGSKPGKLDKDNCDKGGTTLKHSKTPFCVDNSCASCDQVFNATGKCPSIGTDYGQVCVKYGQYCFDFDAAPCSAFTHHFCPIARHKRAGGACTRNNDNKCVDA